MELGTRIVRQYFAQSLKLGGRELAGNGVGNSDLQRRPLPIVNETGAGLGVRISIGNVWLDVVDGCTVHKVSPQDMDDRPFVSRLFYSVKTDAGQAKTIRTERRTGGKHPHPFVTAKTRRTDGKRGMRDRTLISVASITGEFPDKPKVVEALNATNSLATLVFGCENNAPRQRRSQPTLTGDTEF